MIQIRHVQTVSGRRRSFKIDSLQNKIITADRFVLLPGLIDPHVHFRTPGLEYKENWKTAAKASLRGGYTTVFDMPNTLPPTITQQALREKKILIEHQLKEVNIPLRYHLYLGADKFYLDEIEKIKNQAIGIKVFMGCSTQSAAIDDESLHFIFKVAAKKDIIVAIHAEDEDRLKENKNKLSSLQDRVNKSTLIEQEDSLKTLNSKGVFEISAEESSLQRSKKSSCYAMHSELRDEEAARRAVEKAIQLVRLYGTRLYILHVSTRQEVELITQAKSQGLPVFGETTPHHLFLNTNDYASLKGKAIMNPPLRALEHQKALFQAIKEGIIDTVASDHAPHTREEKTKPYENCPAGVPGIETTLPLLLEAYHKNLLSLEDIVRLTSSNAKEIFRLEDVNDYVLVDLNLTRKVEERQLRTKCQWSPFAGSVLRGWPCFTIMNGYAYDLEVL